MLDMISTWLDSLIGITVWTALSVVGGAWLQHVGAFRALAKRMPWSTAK